ncbi:HHE domain-containing protein [Ephemerocybe angulata]|uniref:HHE domain-containing protein n=1 Tax=Ephemerocybe angulata TaxID=980116 RepID=A0A8H6I879_9AGAR|nr:HHE domain-containing protein [Tulosesus angulatus]
MASITKNPLFDAVADDHQEMYEYYDQFVKHNGQPEVQQKWANQLIWEIARHAVGEEIVVYPLMEKYLGEEGLKLANEDRADHQFVKEKLYTLESDMKVGTPEYDQLLKTVMDHLHRHNDSEEQKDLPLLTAKIGHEGSLTAASQFKKSKKFAPTHAHPMAPNRPPFETLVGFMAAPVDKLIDLFESWPSEEEMKEAKGKD